MLGFGVRVSTDVERAEVHEAEVVDELTHGLVELGVAAREGSVLVRVRGKGLGLGLGLELVGAKAPSCSSM